MAKLSSDEQMASILSYLGILVLIPWLAIKKKSPFALFHIRQGMLLFIIEVIVWVLVAILSSFLWFMWVAIMPLLQLLFLVVIIVAIVKAFQGEQWKIPLIGDHLDKVEWVK
ncbi:DUF4870 domain-containing protein [Candidatus Woesearchaeota archaeon]|nr:DUF4870 domain-containing protein [Candidatus Woesearchaeota archaeon]